MKKTAIIGAGKTGRGFIARLIAEAGGQTVFVDKDEAVVNKLNELGGYNISFFGNVRNGIRIDGFLAYTWENAVFDDIDLIIVSVGGTNLEDVGRCLAQRLSHERKYYVITAENASDPSGRLGSAIGMDNVYVSEATVFCTTVEDGEMDIASENYPYLQFDSSKLGGYIPEIRAVRPVENFGNFLKRKLYTYNAASCLIAYIGWLYGYTDYGEAANDPQILRLLDENYAITNRVLCSEFGYDREDQEEFARLSKTKFCDRTIVDTVARNAREPQRKIADGERVIGPMKLIAQYGGEPSALEKTAAAMLLYDNENETEWRRIKSEKTPQQILEEIAGLKKNSALFNNVLKYYNEFKKLL